MLQLFTFLVSKMCCVYCWAKLGYEPTVVDGKHESRFGSLFYRAFWQLRGGFPRLRRRDDSGCFRVPTQFHRREHPRTF